MNSMAFSDSNDVDISRGSSSVCCPGNTSSSLLLLPPPPDTVALSRLSETLESMFISEGTTSSPDFDFFADATLVTASGGKEIAVHRCILAARSPFFRNIFSGTKERSIKFELKEWMKDYDVSSDVIITVLAYLYSGRVKTWPEDVYICVDDECSHEACMPVVKFMVEVLYASFIFQVSELVNEFQRHLLNILDKALTDDILMVLSVADVCSKACERLLDACVQIIVKSDVDFITLDKSLPHNIVKKIIDSRLELGLQGPDSNCFPDKHVKRIHRALDSDDVELLMMLLKEGHTTLDDAYALHYAVAYCDAKTTTELLDLAVADVNCRNPRGYTVLHVAAMRKDPKIIVSLLTKGARPSDLASDGRKALQISKRLTRYSDYKRPTEKGKDSSKDRLCIEILEQAERRDPWPGEASVSLALAGDQLRMKLLYLENRVGLARLLFPMEAKVAMDIAQVDGISEFSLAGINKNLAIAQRTIVDLNEAPFKMKEEHLNRMKALSRTVELGKRFFPRCSEVLNKIMDTEDLSEMAYMGNDTPEERQLKKQRYMELQEVLSKAFSEDKQEFEKVNKSSSSSSTLIGKGMMKSKDKFTF